MQHQVYYLHKTISIPAHLKSLKAQTKWFHIAAIKSKGASNLPFCIVIEISVNPLEAFSTSSTNKPQLALLPASTAKRSHFKISKP